MNKKEAYEKKVQAQIDEWNADIEKLKAKGAQAEADAHINYHDQIEELRQRKDTVSKKLAHLKEANDESWEDLKAGLEEGVDLFKSTVDSIKSRYK